MTFQFAARSFINIQRRYCGLDIQLYFLQLLTSGTGAVIAYTIVHDHRWRILVTRKSLTRGHVAFDTSGLFRKIAVRLD